MRDEQAVVPYLNGNLALRRDNKALPMFDILLEGAFELRLIGAEHDSLSVPHVGEPESLVAFALLVKVSALALLSVVLPLAHVKLAIVIKAASLAMPHILAPISMVLVEHRAVG